MLTSDPRSAAGIGSHRDGATDASAPDVLPLLLLPPLVLLEPTLLPPLSVAPAPSKLPPLLAEERAGPPASSWLLLEAEIEPPHAPDIADDASAPSAIHRSGEEVALRCRMRLSLRAPRSQRSRHAHMPSLTWPPGRAQP